MDPELLDQMPNPMEDAFSIQGIQKEVLAGLWRGMGILGLPLLPIGAYYLFVTIYPHEDWCKPGEETKWPMTETLRFIWAITVISAMAIYIGIIMGLISIIVMLVICATPYTNPISALISFFMNPFQSAKEFSECSALIMKGTGVIK